MFARAGSSFGNILARFDSAVNRALVALRAGLGDAALPAIYMSQRGASTTAGALTEWDDARGAGYGPPLLGAGVQCPLFDPNNGLTFDGVANYLRASNGALSVIVDDCAVILIANGQASIAGRAFELSTGSVTSILTGSQAAGPVWTTKAIAPAAMLANGPLAQVLHSRRKSGVLVGTQIGSAVEVTAADAAGAATPDRFTLGANRTDVAASFAPIVGLRAVILYKGDYAAKQSFLNTFGVALGGTA